MIKVCGIGLIQRSTTSYLESWPLSAGEILKLKAAIIGNRSVYVAVSHSVWADGFHPPKLDGIHKFLIGKKCLAFLPAVEQDAKIWKASQFDAIVDLRMYFPESRINTRAEISLLERSFIDADPGIALHSWGGCWFHVHDHQHFYLDAKKNSSSLISAIRSIMQRSSFEIRNEVSEIIYKKLKKSKNGLSVMSIEDLVAIEGVDLDAIRCENYRALLSPFGGGM